MDLVVMADALGVGTLLVEVDRVLRVLHGGVESTWEPAAAEAYTESDGEFVYRWVTPEGGPTVQTAATMDGTVVCQSEDWQIHHVTQRRDGTYVMAVEELPDDNPVPPFDVPAVAVDCQTGERQPIESLSGYLVDGETRGSFQVGSRRFTTEGDAEGNADVYNEQGVSVNGDDYAGYHAFDPTGSLVVYGDMSASGMGPHYSHVIVARDTRNGEQQWERTLSMVFNYLWVGASRVIVGLPESFEDVLTGSSEPAATLLSLDSATGETVIELEVPPGVRVVYAGN